MNEILELKNLAPEINLLKLNVPLITQKAKAGQFVVLRINEEGERIPMSITDLNPETGILTIIFQEVGKTTAHLAILKKGDVLADVVGPLGIPTHMKNFGTCVCVGGGIGIAPIHFVAKTLKQAGNKVISIIGARSKNLLILEEEMRNLSDELLISTDDGSYGHHGFVTDLLTQLLSKKVKVDFIMAIGPVVMMRAVCKVTAPWGIKTVVSLNPIMVDATGMCGACRVTVGGKTKFACVDGPDFDGHQVDFDELIKRQAMYLKQEKIAMERFTRKFGGKTKQGVGR
ncbi:MAG: sulfide/dihydroorotate dehydrogenase-like FAD/NAD-binding protein [candidate division Zixibacteria bacterium]|nr:sulfide/dihydroorotate dehydrogenase-like FAD/NAD-binding protein [candidate division Zixibacteria bacterium]